MNFIRNMKLSQMIMILALVPIMTTIFFSAQIVIDSSHNRQATNKLAQLATLSVKLSDLVDAQQKERGATAVFLGSSGTKFVSQLAGQRQQTDKKRGQFQRFLADFDQTKYGQDFGHNLQAVLTTLAKMDAIRKNVDSLSVSASKAIGYYTALNGQSLILISAISKLSPNALIASQTIAYANFLQAKEHAGLERAIGAQGFAAGRFSKSALEKFGSLIATEKAYNQAFLSLATPEQKKALKAVMSSAASKEVQRMREIALAGGLQGNLDDISGKTWFDRISEKIKALKGYENQLSQKLLDDLGALEAKAGRAQFNAVLETLIALALVLGLGFAIIKSITASLRNVTSSMTALAQGKLDVELPPVRKNEVGEIIRSVLVFRDNAIKKVALEAEQEELKSRSEEEKRAMMCKLADDFDTSVGSIVQNVSSASAELQSTAQSMTGIAENTSSMSAAVSAASEEASTNVQTVAAAAEEMSHSISDIGNQVSLASAGARQAVAEVEKTGIQIEKLAATADSIGEVVKMISDIADQTNLLALNATIESARAGEAGRGFAVVASEVKELASQTGKATEGIAAQVEEIQRATQAAVNAMGDIGKSIRSVDETSSAIAAAMEQQGAATQEIARNVQEAAAGTEEVSRNIVGVNHASQESGAAAGEVTTAAGELSQQATLLESEMEKFIAQVRAA